MDMRIVFCSGPQLSYWGEVTDSVLARCLYIFGQGVLPKFSTHVLPSKSRPTWVPGYAVNIHNYISMLQGSMLQSSMNTDKATGLGK